MGQPFRADERSCISADMLDEVARSEGVAIERGDVLLVRTGWTGWYTALSQAERDRIDRTTPQPGLAAVERTAEWLWDHHVAAVAADNVSLEPMPLDFREGHFLHFWLTPCLGIPIGELWWLDDLAAACARHRRWKFQLVSAPLNVRGGIGSPPTRPPPFEPVHGAGEYRQRAYRRVRSR